MKISQTITKPILLLSIPLYSLIFASSCNKEVSITRPDTPPPNGYIYLDSNPKGFEIYLDNKDRARITPDSLTWLSTGTYNITLKKNLFRDSSFTISIVEGEKPSILIDYTKNPAMFGSITCASTPAKAAIMFNDSSIGHTTPYTIQNILPGNYYVKYHLPNYRDASILVTVSSSVNSSAYKFLVDTTHWQDYTPANSGIFSGDLTCVTVDKNNIVYVGSSSDGFFSFDGTRWKSYNNAFSRHINCSTVDRNNIVLLGTPDYLTAYDGSTFYEYGLQSSEFPDFHIQTISVDKGSNWYIGTQKGLTEVNRSNGTFYWKQLSWINFDDDNISNKYIVCSAIDNNYNVWVGILNNGIAMKDPTGKWLHYTTSNSKLQSNNVTAIAAGLEGEVWIGYGLDNNFGHGLTCIVDSTWTNYNNIPGYSKVAAIFIDKGNVMWIATNQGLIMLTSPTTPIQFNYDNTGLNINGVTGISEDFHGNIWISTSSGLYQYKSSH